MLEIRAPRIFAHAGRLPPRFASRDPREPDFAEDVVRIDLRGCEFVYPPAVLWCAVYAALVRRLGIACELLVPENLGVASYLMTVGLYSTLAEIGVEVDQRGISMGDESQIVLPLRQFADAPEVENLVDETIDRLMENGFPGSFGSIVSDTFGELGINAAQHADSPIDAFGMVQFYHFQQHGKQFACVVADGGIGIRRALARNPDIDAPYDWTAIEYALRENVSGTGSPSRGMGLFGIADATRKSPHRGLIIHSGIGMEMLGADGQANPSQRTSVRFPGTLAAARISA